MQGFHNDHTVYVGLFNVGPAWKEKVAYVHTGQRCEQFVSALTTYDFHFYSNSPAIEISGYNERVTCETRLLSVDI